MKELYRRIVRAIIKWLLRHCPEAIPESLLDKAQQDTREALKDLSIKVNLHLLKQLWDECPPEHLLVVVRIAGSPNDLVDIQAEIAETVSNPPRNEMGTVDSFASMLGYSVSRLNTTLPRSGVISMVFNPHRYAELDITPDLYNTVQGWLADDSIDPRNIIVGWKYVPIPKDEPGAVEAE